MAKSDARGDVRFVTVSSVLSKCGGILKIMIAIFSLFFGGWILRIFQNNLIDVIHQRMDKVESEDKSKNKRESKLKI